MITATLADLDEPDAAPLFRSRFERAGTVADIVLVGGDAGLVEDAKESLDRLWRRWHPAGMDSDLARLNTSVDPVAVGPETLLLAGLLADRGAAVEVDYQAATIRRTGPDPVDPAGLAIGLSADMVVQDALDAGAAGAAIVLAGGDPTYGSVRSVLRVAGVAAHRGGWRIHLAGPDDLDTTMRLVEGGLATGIDQTGGRHVVIDHQAWQAQTLTLDCITEIPTLSSAAEIPGLKSAADRS